MTPTKAENPPRTSTLLAELLPIGVITAELSGEGNPKLLLVDERQLLGRAVPKRAREFAAGRLCARYAVEQFGIENFAVGAHGDRRPRWPSFLTGSITHTDGLSAAAVGERVRFHAIGIDVERIGRVPGEIWSHILLASEMAWLKSLPVSEQAKVVTLMFSAKEAFYKCQYEVTRQWLEFKDVAVEFFSGNLDRGSFAVRPVRSIKLFERGSSSAIVAFASTNDIVLTAMTIAAH